MKGCVFITTGPATPGFQLAGFAVIVADRGSVVGEFEKIVRRGGAELVIIDEQLLTETSGAQVNALEQRWPQGAMVILPAPGPDEEVSGEDYAGRLIRRVLGYQVKLT